MNVCFIFVNYNNSKLSVDCVNSILSCEKQNVEIVIVDNNSSPEEKCILNQLSSLNHVDILYLDKNIGYFPAHVKGQEFIYSHGNSYDYMIVANNDMIFHSDFLDNLNTLHIPSNVMVLSPDIITLDGVHQNPHFIHKLSRVRKLLYHVYYSNYYIATFLMKLLENFSLKRSAKHKVGYDVEQPIYIGFGACFILTNFFMNKIKYLDNRSFLMGEEVLLMQQVKEANGVILYKPDLKVTHLDSATFKKLSSKFTFNCEKNAYKIYRKYLN